MKKAIVFSSTSGNTQKLAKAIYTTIGEEIYCGEPNESALDADMIFVGSWTIGATCTKEIKEFIEKLENKKVFIFMNAGYGSTEEFFAPIINSVKALVKPSNEIIGEFICQAKVSEAKMDAIKNADSEKFEKMKAELLNSQSHPDDADISKLKEMIANLSK